MLEDVSGPHEPASPSGDDPYRSETREEEHKPGE